MNQVVTAPAEDVEPFWRRLGAITTYPLQMAALSTIGIYALFRLVQVLPGLAGSILNLLVQVAVYKYASDVLLATAHGRMKAPEGWANSEETAGWVQVKVQAAMIVLIVLAFAALPLEFAIAATVFIAIGQPGAAMSAATDMNFWVALNPLTWLKVMGRLGWPYFLMAILCGLVWLSQANAQALLVPFLPGWLGLIVFYFLAHYATVVNFHLMGYLIYQYRDELGWEVERQVVLKRPQDADQELLDQSEALAREGRMAEAEEILRAELATRGASAGVHERYRKLVRLRGDTAALLKHGHDYLNVLVALDQDKKAIELLRECLALDKTFQPTAPDQVQRLARRASELAMPQVALDLVAGFLRQHPRHRDVPHNALISAKILTERMNQEGKAYALLSQVRKAFPEHPATAEVDSYIKFLESLGAAKAQPAAG
jgi:hypothetical protein